MRSLNKDYYLNKPHKQFLNPTKNIYTVRLTANPDLPRIFCSPNSAVNRGVTALLLLLIAYTTS